MRLDRWSLAAIAAMAAVTFACRAGGYLLFRQIRPGARLRALLGYLPGALFVAYVVPALVGGGVPQWAGAAVTVGAMLATRSIGLATIIGTAAAWAVWRFN